MDLDFNILRKNRVRSAFWLRTNRYSVKEIAEILYGNHSESAQNRVRALLSKYRKKIRLALYSSPQPQLFCRNPQPQPCAEEKQREGEERTRVVKVPETVEKRDVKETKVIKIPETAEKGKASETVTTWLDESLLARQFADECYDTAKKFGEHQDYDTACRYMELVTRFLRLSQSARKEYDLDELNKKSLELDAKNQEGPHERR